ncbi:MAG: hypothetical protein EP310_04550 [Bacteroidetes bacterium]|nr:MAG: hypothetical protein EP310_04550 [Bacteroidota bacterium]
MNQNRFFLILIIFISAFQPRVLAKDTNKVHFKETIYEGKPHFIIETKDITWYYDIEGGGFSRMIDADGNDWISFKREPWGEYPASAASAFRGIPNLVFKSDDGGAGHPGHEKCNSWLESEKIITESKSGKWKWCWTFFDDHALLEILKTDCNQPYWFLYEGTPGGNYMPMNYYFGTSSGGPETNLPDYYKNNILTGNFQWMYAGSNAIPNIFYMLQLIPDDKTDMLSFLGNTPEGLKSPDGMTVFGFGRDDKGNSLLTGNQKFVVGFYPEKVDSKKQHQRFSGYIAKQLKLIQQ